jgi:BirA family biotin operon repressor/biotin-[acetyl-CoA-carboxylase] ligase
MSLGEALDRLNAAEFRFACSGQRIGNRVEVRREVTSTNDVVLQMASENDEGLVVFAESQTAGRGQYGKNWASAPHKGLWFSILLRPKMAPSDAPRLTSWAAHSVTAAIHEQLSLSPAVTPPNDVFVGQRKVAGVLLEMRAVPGASHFGILGIGVNVNQQPDDFPPELMQQAGSLAMACGGHVDRQQLAIAILRTLDRGYRVFAS